MFPEKYECKNYLLYDKRYFGQSIQRKLFELGFLAKSGYYENESF